MHTVWRINTRSEFELIYHHNLLRASAALPAWHMPYAESTVGGQVDHSRTPYGALYRPYVTGLDDGE